MQVEPTSQEPALTKMGIAVLLLVACNARSSNLNHCRGSGSQRG